MWCGWGVSCSQCCDLPWGTLCAPVRGVATHTNTKFGSFFLQATIFIGDKSQTPNHCRFTDSLKKILFCPIPPSLLSPHYTQDFFAYPFFPKLLHPFKLSSEQRSFNHSHALAVSGFCERWQQADEGWPRPGTWPPGRPSHEDSLCLHVTRVIPSAC